MRKRLLITIAVMILSGAEIWLYFYFPLYPSPYLDVNSYDELQKKLEDTPEIILLEPDQVLFADSFELHHDRSRFARPKGCSVSGEILDGKARLIIQCQPTETTDSSPVSVMEYRGIAIKTYVWQSEIVYSQTLSFYSNGFYYTISSYIDLPDDQLDSHTERAQSILTECAHAFVDKTYTY